MTSLKEWVHPSLNSISGSFISCIDSYSFFNSKINDSETPSIGERILRVVVRSFAALITILCTALDLMIWTALTVTIYPAYKIGARNHLANLTSTLACTVLALGMIGGYVPELDMKRPFYKEYGLTSVPPNSYNCLANEIVEASLERIRMLITQRGADPNSKNDGTCTPLTALLRADPSTDPNEMNRKVELLLEFNADPNLGDNFSKPLVIAAARLNTAVVQTLLKHHVNPSSNNNAENPLTQGSILTSVFTDYFGPLGFHLHMQDVRPLFKLVDESAARLNIAEQLIRAGADLGNSDLDDLDTLYKAAVTTEKEDKERKGKNEKQSLVIWNAIKQFYKSKPTTLIPQGSLADAFIRRYRNNGTYKHFDWLIANKEQLKKVHNEVVDARAKVIHEALKPCSVDGMPKELATIISEYCS